METRLLLPDGRGMKPQIFGEGGSILGSMAFGPTHINYGKEVVQKGDSMSR
jgi:hypothetical protein